MEIWEWNSHYSTCKLNFENRNCPAKPSREKFVHFWSKTKKFAFDFFLHVVHCCYEPNPLEKSKLLYGDLGMDLSTVNLQAEFRKFLFGYLEVVVVPPN